MRFRGLPLEFNCGPVNLQPINSSSTRPLLPVCGPCGFVSVSYYVLTGCGHVQCDSCALVFPEKLSHEMEERNHGCCTVCNEASEATPMRISITALEKLQFSCPCGEEGTLKELRQHRRACRVSDPRLTGAVSPDSTTALVSSSGASSQQQQPLDADSLTSIVRESLLVELQRIEEDIVNRLELRRTPLESQVQDFEHRVENLETELSMVRLAQREAARNAPSISHAEVVRNAASIRDLRQQMTQLEMSTSNSRDDVTKWMIAHQSQSVLLWFNVKKLLQNMNRHGNPAASENQDVMIAGYPCRVHIEVDIVDMRKMLGIYIGTSNARSQAEWPMKRRIEFKIYNNDGQPFIEDDIETTDPEAGSYFKGPNSPGKYGISDFCTIEELTNEFFYRRNHGMICVGVESSVL